MRQLAWVLGLFLAAAVGIVTVWTLIEPGRGWAPPTLALAGAAALYPLLRQGGADRFMAALERAQDDPDPLVGKLARLKLEQLPKRAAPARR